MVQWLRDVESFLLPEVGLREILAGNIGRFSFASGMNFGSPKVSLLRDPYLFTCDFELRNEKRSTRILNYRRNYLRDHFWSA